MPRAVLLALALSLPLPALAVGGDDTGPPPVTETVTTCENGQVWSDSKKACVDPQSGALSDEQRIRAVRELAYAGRYAEAARVLAAMPDAGDDRVLTYRGFLARMMGAPDRAAQAYRAALARNPDNLLARSYYGQGLLAAGDRIGARAQLIEIRARGGADTWAARALTQALATGIVYRH